MARHGFQIITGPLGLELNADGVQGEAVRLLHYPEGNPNPNAAVDPELVAAPLGSIAISDAGTWQKSGPTTWTPFGATGATDTYVTAGAPIADDQLIRFTRSSGQTFDVNVTPYLITNIALVGNELQVTIANGTVWTVDMSVFTNGTGNPVTSGSVTGGTLTLNLQDLSTVDIDVSSLIETVVSTDLNNDITPGADGGAFLDVSAVETQTSLASYDGGAESLGLRYVAEDGANDDVSWASVATGVAAAVRSPIGGNVLTVAGDGLLYVAAGGSPTIVSTDLNNDITPGGDGGAFLDVQAHETVTSLGLDGNNGLRFVAEDGLNDDVTWASAAVGIADAVRSTDGGNALGLGTDLKLYVAPGGSPTIVSTDLNNDITPGGDGGAYLDVQAHETLTSFALNGLTGLRFVAEDGANDDVNWADAAAGIVDNIISPALGNAIVENGGLLYVDSAALGDTDYPQKVGGFVAGVDYLISGTPLNIDLAVHASFDGIGAPGYEPAVFLRGLMKIEGVHYTLTKDGFQRVTNVVFLVDVLTTDEVSLAYHPNI